MPQIQSEGKALCLVKNFQHPPNQRSIPSAVRQHPGPLPKPASSVHRPRCVQLLFECASRFALAQATAQLLSTKFGLYPLYQLGVYFKPNRLGTVDVIVKHIAHLVYNNLWIGHKHRLQHPHRFVSRLCCILLVSSFFETVAVKVEVNRKILSKCLGLMQIQLA